jgi:hypothetical protein
MFASKAKTYQGVRGRKKQINAKKNRALREVRDARPKNGPVFLTESDNTKK